MGVETEDEREDRRWLCYFCWTRRLAGGSPHRGAAPPYSQLAQHERLGAKKRGDNKDIYILNYPLRDRRRARQGVARWVIPVVFDDSTSRVDWGTKQQSARK
jgi:hypothetical protein